ncbi:YkoP family protein [Fictibacillus sp. NRS-1165]|uniref:YkoP family protein n=1 Tax=Fictibacillus sp. NRS-1165 TaxID=3144463 RepID=UPI003D233041
MRLRLYFISVWNMFDPLYYFFTRLQYLERTRVNTTIFRVRLTRYKGRTVVLSDGTCIKKNDVLVKIHLHNVQILKELQGMDNDLKKAMILYKKAKESLPYLALYIQRQKNEGEIKGIIGITMLNKGYERLGFEPYKISSRPYKWFKQLAHYPIFFPFSATCKRTKEHHSKVFIYVKRKLVQTIRDTIDTLLETSPLITSTNFPSFCL